MELLGYLGILRRRSLMIVLLCATATISAAAMSLLLPDEYEATALVLVRPQENIKVTSNKNEKELLNYPVSQATVEVPNNTYIAVIKSRAIAEKIVRKLHLDTPADEPQGGVSHALKKTFADLASAVFQIAKYGKTMSPVTSSFDRAVQDVMKGITAGAVRDTYILEITYAATDPKLAATVANTAADLFVEYIAENNTSNAKAISLFVGKHLRTIEDQLEAARRVYREFKEQEKTVSFKEETTEKIKAIAELETALEKIEVRLAGLLRTLMPAHPQVQAAEAEKERVQATLNQRKAELRQLPEKEKQLATLNLAVLGTEEIYQLVRREYEETQIREGMHTSEMTIASYATPPAYPTRPIRGRYAGAAFAVSLTIGIGLAFLLEYVNTTLRSMEDVERVLQLPVLATLPPMGPAE